MMEPRVTLWADKNGQVVVDFAAIDPEVVKDNLHRVLKLTGPLAGSTTIWYAVIPQDTTPQKFAQMVLDQRGYRTQMVPAYEIQALTPMRSIGEGKFELYATVYNRVKIPVVTRLVFTSNTSFGFYGPGIAGFYGDPCCAGALTENPPRSIVKTGMPFMLNTNGELPDVESSDGKSIVTVNFSAASLSTYTFSSPLPK